jgi:hypothetical protein
MQREGKIARWNGHFVGGTVIRNAPNREGIGWNRKDVEAIRINSFWAIETEVLFMDIIAELKSNYEEASTLWATYEKKLETFRSMVKNDVSSLEASARKTTDAVHKMNKAYGDAISQMTSEEMATAINNAERLAKAMEALAAVQSQKLTVQIMEKV